MKFVWLTHRQPTGRPERVLVNLEQVVLVWPTDDGARLRFNDGGEYANSLDVIESSEVVAMLAGAAVEVRP
jgi:hypothetical protein